MSTAACTTTVTTFSKRFTWASQPGRETAACHASRTSTSTRRRQRSVILMTTRSNTSPCRHCMSMAGYGTETRIMSPSRGRTGLSATRGISGRLVVVRMSMSGSRWNLVQHWILVVTGPLGKDDLGVIWSGGRTWFKQTQDCLYEVEVSCWAHVTPQGR